MCLLDGKGAQDRSKSPIRVSVPETSPLLSSHSKWNVMT